MSIFLKALKRQKPRMLKSGSNMMPLDVNLPQGNKPIYLVDSIWNTKLCQKSTNSVFKISCPVNSGSRVEI